MLPTVGPEPLPLGQVGSTFAMRTAIAKAQGAGVALTNTGHIGAAGYYGLDPPFAAIAV